MYECAAVHSRSRRHPSKAHVLKGFDLFAPTRALYIYAYTICICVHSICIVCTRPTQSPPKDAANRKRIVFSIKTKIMFGVRIYFECLKQKWSRVLRYVRGLGAFTSTLLLQPTVCVCVWDLACCIFIYTYTRSYIIKTQCMVWCTDVDPI